MEVATAAGASTGGAGAGAGGAGSASAGARTGGAGSAGGAPPAPPASAAASAAAAAAAGAGEGGARTGGAPTPPGAGAPAGGGSGKYSLNTLPKVLAAYKVELERTTTPAEAKMTCERFMIYAEKALLDQQKLVYTTLRTVQTELGAMGGKLSSIMKDLLQIDEKTTDMTPYVSLAGKQKQDDYTRFRYNLIGLKKTVENMIDNYCDCLPFVLGGKEHANKATMVQAILHQMTLEYHSRLKVLNTPAKKRKKQDKARKRRKRLAAQKTTDVDGEEVPRLTKCFQHGPGKSLCGCSAPDFVQHLWELFQNNLSPDFRIVGNKVMVPCLNSTCTYKECSCENKRTCSHKGGPVDLEAVLKKLAAKHLELKARLNKLRKKAGRPVGEESASNAKIEIEREEVTEALEGFKYFDEVVATARHRVYTLLRNDTLTNLTRAMAIPCPLCKPDDMGDPYANIAHAVDRRVPTEGVDNRVFRLCGRVVQCNTCRSVVCAETAFVFANHCTEDEEKKEEGAVTHNNCACSTFLELNSFASRVTRLKNKIQEKKEAEAEDEVSALEVELKRVKEEMETEKALADAIKCNGCGALGYRESGCNTVKCPNTSCTSTACVVCRGDISVCPSTLLWSDEQKGMLARLQETKGIQWDPHWHFDLNLCGACATAIGEYWAPIVRFDGVAEGTQ